MDFVVVQSGDYLSVKEINSKIEDRYPILDYSNVEYVFQYIERIFFLDLATLYDGDMRRPSLLWDAEDFHSFIADIQQEETETKRIFLKENFSTMVEVTIRLLQTLLGCLTTHVKFRRRIIRKNISIMLFVQYCVNQIPSTPGRVP